MLWLIDCLNWLIDFFKCLTQGHCFKIVNNTYRYCLRCGHLEVIEEEHSAS